MVMASKKKTERMEFRVDSSWTARAQKQADRLRMSLAAYVRMAITERMERDEQAQKQADRQPPPNNN